MVFIPGSHMPKFKFQCYLRGGELILEVFSSLCHICVFKVTEEEYQEAKSCDS